MPTSISDPSVNLWTLVNNIIILNITKRVKFYILYVLWTAWNSKIQIIESIVDNLKNTIFKPNIFCIGSINELFEYIYIK